jgi:hypothetical protein
MKDSRPSIGCIIPVTEAEAAEQPKADEGGMNRQDYYSESEAPSAMRTTVSTVIEQNSERELVEADATNLDNRSEAGLSPNSYASSASSTSGSAVFEFPTHRTIMMASFLNVLIAFLLCQLRTEHLGCKSRSFSDARTKYTN